MYGYEEEQAERHYTRPSKGQSAGISFFCLAVALAILALGVLSGGCAHRRPRGSWPGGDIECQQAWDRGWRP